jgi:hypothetical protein
LWWRLQDEQVVTGCLLQYFFSRKFKYYQMKQTQREIVFMIAGAFVGVMLLLAIVVFLA